MSYNIPAEVEEECYDHDWHTGQTKRIRHVAQEDGSDCSSKKDAALSILRKADGWWYNCFRCGEHGFKPDTAIAVEQVEKELSALRMIKQYKSVESPSLPVDFIKVQDTPQIEKAVPNHVYSLLWSHSVSGKLFQQYNFGWSGRYQRCIIPIYEYETDRMKTKLVGWVGRDCSNLTKKERAKKKVPKYILRKSKEYNRIYFHAPAESDTYVIVEDALSAIKIHDACDVNAIALLTTHIPTTMLLKFKHKKIILWLDEDQLSNMIMTTVKGSSLGMDVSYIHTLRDPKCYNEFAIQYNINKNT
jgi:hypothetical protein